MISLSIIKKINKQIYFNIKIYNIFVLFLIIFLFIVWLIKSPDPRLGFWIFALMPTIFLASVFNISLNSQKNKIVYFLNIILLINLFYFSILNIYEINKKNHAIDFLKYEKKITNNSNIIKREKFGYKPVPLINENGVITDFTWNYCWNFVDCYFNEYDVKIEKLILNYNKIIILEN